MSVLRRSQLYVPGNNEKMITKAPKLGADSVILDLEDAVPENSKDEARDLVARLSRDLEWGNSELCVRINPRGTKSFQRDVAVLKGCNRVDCVVVPKAEEDCSSIHVRTKKALIPIIETARGLMMIRDVSASIGVRAITYGAADFAASVGGSVSSYQDNSTIKTMVVAAAASMGVDAIDNVFFDLKDSEGFRREALAARSLGYVGKQVVHPSQVALANEVFTPTVDEVAWARRIVTELGSASAVARGAISVDGTLADAVHLRLAEGILERARAAEAGRNGAT